MKYLTIAALPLALLAACGERPTEATAVDDTVDGPNGEALIAAPPAAGDFGELKLGAKIVGPQGPEVQGALTNAAGTFADIRSFVACPEGMDPCDPKTAPAGTIYTYVHVVIPGTNLTKNADGVSTEQGNPGDVNHVERVTGFRSLRKVSGFTGSAGYSFAEAKNAMGSEGEVGLMCDKGQLVWRMGGGTRWNFKEPITFYWQSTVPPAGPAEAYAIEADFTQATGTGPFPGVAAGATNACEAAPAG